MRTIIRLPLVLLLSLYLAACGDGGGSGGGKLTGQLMVAGIEGVQYETQSLSGRTGPEGEFEFREGETIRFHLGDLVLAEAVPAKAFLSPLDFVEENRVSLEVGGVGDQGLTSHRPIQSQLVTQATTARNITRFLMSLDDDNTIGEDSNVRISQRTIDQINEILPTLDSPIDFTVSESQFASEPSSGAFGSGGTRSPANQLLREICFFPEDDERCDPIPTEEEIAAAEQAGDEEKAEELRDKKELIEDSKRRIAGIASDQLVSFLSDEIAIFEGRAARPFFLSMATLNVQAGNDQVFEVELKATRDFELKDMEVISTEETIIEVIDFSAATKTIRFRVIGEAGEQAQLLINFEPEGDYRWFRLALRALIE